jgi:hypothetical protein
MVAEDFLHDQQVRQWLDGVEPAWTLLTFDSLRALRREPSARQNAIRIANDLSADEIAGSAVTRNTFILLRHAIERSDIPGPEGLPCAPALMPIRPGRELQRPLLKPSHG